MHESFVEKAHYTSARFEAEISEFDTCKLTPEYIEGFAAPFVKESLVKMGMELIEVIPITHNDTKLIIGKIRYLLIEDDCIRDDGNVDLKKIESVCISGLENYHIVSPFRSFPYAKVEQLPNF